MSSIKTTHIDGDVSIGRNVAIGGGASIQGDSLLKGNVKVLGWLDAPNIKHANKGMFATLENLEASYPIPHNGWWALVGTTLPGDLYIAYEGKWIYKGEYSGSISIESEVLETNIKNLQEDFATLTPRLEEFAGQIEENRASWISLENTLNDAVDEWRADLQGCVKLDGIQTITGDKVFTGIPTFAPMDTDYPFIVNSDGKVDNLNADMLDGWHAQDFVLNGAHAVLSDLTLTGVASLEGSLYAKSSFNSNSVTSVKSLEAFRVGSNADYSTGWGTYLWSYGNGRGFIQQGAAESGNIFSLTLNPLGGNVGVNIGNSDNAQYPLDVKGDIRSRGVLRGYGLRTTNICFECDSDGTFGSHGNEINTTSGRMWLQYDNPGNIGLCAGGGTTTIYGPLVARSSLTAQSSVEIAGGLRCQGLTDLNNVTVNGSLEVVQGMSATELQVGNLHVGGDTVFAENAHATFGSASIQRHLSAGNVNTGSITLNYNADTDEYGAVKHAHADGNFNLVSYNYDFDCVQVGDSSNLYTSVHINAGSGFIALNAAEVMTPHLSVYGSLYAEQNLSVDGCLFANTLQLGDAQLYYDPVQDAVICDKQLIQDP